MELCYKIYFLLFFSSFMSYFWKINWRIWQTLPTCLHRPTQDSNLDLLHVSQTSSPLQVLGCLLVINDKWIVSCDLPPGPGKEGCSVEGRVPHHYGCLVSPLAAVWWSHSFPFPPWSLSATTREIYKCFHFQSHENCFSAQYQMQNLIWCCKCKDLSDSSNVRWNMKKITIQ